jgi:hypothetical protein
MNNSAIVVAAAAALIGISVAASPADAQSMTTGRSGFHRGGGGGPARGPVQGGRGIAKGGPGAHSPGARGGGHARGRGGWRGAGPGPGPQYHGGHGYHRGGPGPGLALGAAALGLAAGAILGAPAYVNPPPPPPPYADECMQQVWWRGAWRWRNVCD